MLVVGSAVALGTMIGLGADYIDKHWNTDGASGDIVSQLDGLTNDPTDVTKVWDGTTTNKIGEAIEQATDWFNEF